MMNGDGESCKSNVADLESKLESKQSFESAVEDLISLVRDQYASASPSDQALIYAAVCNVETQLTTKLTAPKFWAAGLKLFDAAAAVVSQPEEVEKMQSYIKQAHEAVKEQDGDVDAVPNSTASDDQSTENAEPSLVPESNGNLTEDAPLESTESPVTEELQNRTSEVASEKREVFGDWNSALPNGATSGWTSAEPPPGVHNGTIPPEAAAPESGLLGSAPPPAKEQLPQQLYTYYMVRIPRPLDNQGKVEINSAEQRLQDKTDVRNVHNSNVQAARSKRNEAFENRKAARQVERDCLQVVRAKYDEIRPLKDNLRKLKDAGRNVREKTRDLPISEEDLDHRIASLEWRIQHESIPLKEEKQLMRDIKQLQSSRETVRANAALYSQVHESLGQREEIEEALKPLNAEYKQLEAELKAATMKREQADAEYELQDKALGNVMGQLQNANVVRQEAYEVRKSLKEQEYLRTRDFYDNKRDIQQAKQLASQPNNRKAVEEFCNAQVDRILELWNKNDEFRKNYIKDNERSTVKRLGTLDGRSLGPDEEPPRLASHADLVPAAAPVPQTKASATENGLPAENANKDAAQAGTGRVKAPVSKDTKPASAATDEQKPAAKRESKDTLVDPAVSQSVVEEEVSKEELEREAAELKEKRRVAEMAKAKEAEERKKRIAERSQSKALAWAQKEAEKKEREREKKARKKAAYVPSAETPSSPDSTPAAESNESGTETQEPVREETETKVSSRQRKRGVTNVQKRAAKAAAASSAMAPATATQQKVFGLPLQVLLSIGAGVVIIVTILLFIYLRGSASSGSGDYKEGTRFKARPDVSSQSYSQH